MITPAEPPTMGVASPPTCRPYSSQKRKRGVLLAERSGQNVRKRGACVNVCEMDVRIPEDGKDDQRVPSTECSLCQTCITLCAKDALKLTFGFDLGGKKLSREREPKTASATVAASSTE